MTRQTRPWQSDYDEKMMSRKNLPLGEGRLQRTKRDPESLLVTECLYRIDPGRKVGGDERG